MEENCCMRRKADGAHDDCAYTIATDAENSFMKDKNASAAGKDTGR